MQLTAIDVRDVRRIASAALEPAPGLNLITGDNGAGKTSILEAIHVLATGRSFAASRMDRVVRDGGGPLRVVARVRRAGASAEHRLGIERAIRGKPRLRLDGRNAERMAEIARVLPVIAVHPGSHELVGGGPGERRRLLDLGLFHVERDFHAIWQRYGRAREQRNALLRAGRDARELAPWEAEVASMGEQLDRLRAGYVADLAPRVEALAREIVGDEVRIEYRRGWPGGESLAEAIDRVRPRDREQFGTSVGPHRADLAMRLGGSEVRQRVSRGQQKLLVYVLRLAQAEQLGAGPGGGCALLLDDLPAELDRRHRDRVLGAAGRIGAQLFVTALEPETVEVPEGTPWKRFHVERGAVSEVLQ